MFAYHQILVWNISGPIEAADGFGSGRWAVGSRIAVPVDWNKHQVCTALFSLTYLHRDTRTCAWHFASSVVNLTSSSCASVFTNTCTFWQHNTVTTYTEFSVSAARLRAAERTTSMLHNDRRCCPLCAVLSLVFWVCIGVDQNVTETKCIFFNFCPHKTLLNNSHVRLCFSFFSLYTVLC